MTTPLLRRALRAPFVLACDVFDSLPTETQTHARAATKEGCAALRSLADGATDAMERTIDHIAAFISKQ